MWKKFMHLSIAPAFNKKKRASGPRLENLASN